MSAAATAAALLVDYGGVMTRPTGECHRAWCESEGVDPRSLEDTLRVWSSCVPADRSPIWLVETGAMTQRDFECELALRLRTRTGRPVESKGLLDRIFAFFAPDPAMHAMVRRARESGIRTGLVTNSWGSTLPWDDVGGLFDTAVVSCAVGTRKPERRIYEIAAAQLNTPVTECVFVDDVDGNVHGAAAAGMTGVHHVGATGTRHELWRLFGEQW
jgi:putative hydrolase of the HAD superfamily